LRAGRDGATAERLGRRIVHTRPGAGLGDLRQRELDRVWRCIDDNKDGRLPALDGCQHISQEVPVRKTPILFRHLHRIRREPQDIECFIGPATLEPLVALNLRITLAQLR